MAIDTRISVQSVPPYGTLDDLTFTSVNGADTFGFTNDGRTVVIMKNDSGAGKTCTILGVADPYDRTEDEVLNPAAGEISISNFLPPSIFNQPGTQDVEMTFDDGTSVSVAVVSFTRNK